MDLFFNDRYHAGRQLAEALTAYRDNPDVLVLALPRGGVPVAYEVARALHAELDILVVRKLGLPQQPELAMGAMTSGGACTFNEDVIQIVKVTPGQIESVIRREESEIKRREQKYRGVHPPLQIQKRTVIAVDDGVATGASMQAAVKALRSLNPAKIVVAVPVGAADAIRNLEILADACICLFIPARFYAVGQWYRDFTQITDEEVRRLLLSAQQEFSAK